MISSGSRDPFGDQIGDAMRDDARLARARAGEDQQRPFGVTDRVCCSGLRRGEEIQPSYSTVTLLARFRG